MSMETNTATNTYSSTCRYCSTTVTWSEEANMPTDGNGMICCDGCYDEATGYGAYPDEGEGRVAKSI